MARWQLTEPHYLNTLDTKWEFETKNRSTGRSERKQFRVPLHLDPNIEQDWNYTDRMGNNIVDGKIVVCWEGKGEDRDIVFEGDPTPGMLPLDEEARAVSAKFAWKPTKSLEEADQFNSHTQQLLINLTEDLKGAAAQAPQAEGLGDFMKGMMQMMQMQTEILATIAGKQVSISKPEPTEAEELARIAKELDLEPVFDQEKPLPPPPKRPVEARARRA